MSWRDELRRVTIDGKSMVGASFRGVPFFVESSERGGGRRNLIHEFPYRDIATSEDLGQRARTFRLEGYVVGADYLAKKEALIAALEASGAGQVVLPYDGTFTVVLSAPFGVRDTKTDGGMATFAMEFTEAPENEAVPTVVDDSVDRVASSADAAIEASSADLVEEYDVESLPGFALESCAHALSTAATALGVALGPVAVTTQELAQLSGQVSLVTSSATSLVRTPAAAFDAFRAMLVQLVDTVASAPGAVVDALIETYAVNLSTPVIATTLTRARELANQTALVAAIRRVLAVEAARLAPLVSYVSIDEAVAARGRVTAMLDDQAASADDASYPALVDLRSKLLRAVPGGQAFASVVTHEVREVVPSLLLSYQLYGSTKNEPDIVARNGISHPGFVSGSLQVLTDE